MLNFDDIEGNLKPIYSDNAEKAVIGGLITNPHKLEIVLECVSESDFYIANHRIIFNKITELSNKSKPIDIITLCDALNDAQLLESVGGMPYVIGMAKNTPSVANIASYAEAIKNKSTERALLTISEDIYQTVYSGDHSTEEKVMIAQAKVMSLEAHGGEDIAQANSAIKNVIELIDERFNSDGAIHGLKTGFQEIDERIGGLRGANLMILAARPAMGKTTWAMNVAENAALREETPVLIFSMEMSSTELMERMLSSTSGIPLSIIRSGKLQDEHWPKLTAGVALLKDRPIYIDDRPSLDIKQIRSSARRMHKKHGIGLVIIDYLQLATSRNAKSREQEVAEVSRGLKALAKETDIPVIAVAQINRDCEKGQNKRPSNHHLRESGSIEQDADIIAFLYRDEVYNENSQHKGIAEVIFTKVRNGTIGTDYIQTRLEINQFKNLDRAVPEITNNNKGGFQYD